jgi:phage terminase small subunit
MASELVPRGLPGKPLTARQEAFIIAYVGVAAFNAVEACRIAGYSDSSTAVLSVQGARLLGMANVRARLDEYMEAASMTGYAALRKLTEIAEAPLHMHQQVLKEYKGKDGIIHQTVRQDLSSQVKALELILKARGMLREQVDINVQHTRTIVGVNISDVTGRSRQLAAGSEQEAIDSTATDIGQDIGQDTHTDTDE